MANLHRAACLALLTSGLLAGRSFAQDPPALAVSPGKATMLVGETHTFRAVGKDGRMRHNVRWNVSPEQAASITIDGDEVTVEAKEISSSVFLTAFAEGDSATATVDIRPGDALPIGTKKWSVAEIPGCKDKKIIPAVPSAGGPDIYVQEECPKGTFVRAITDDGRELWRRQISGSGAALPGDKAEAPGAHLNARATSVCDTLSPGMTKEQVSKLLSERNLSLEEKQRESGNWALEEDGFRCTISFDAKTETVVKKKKTIVSD